MFANNVNLNNTMNINNNIPFTNNYGNYYNNNMNNINGNDEQMNYNPYDVWHIANEPLLL